MDTTGSRLCRRGLEVPGENTGPRDVNNQNINGYNGAHIQLAQLRHPQRFVPQVWGLAR